MFEDYLEDANYFFECGRQHNINEKVARRYYRAAIFCCVSAMESFISYVADTLSKGAPLEAQAIAFLRDKKFVFRINKPDLLVEEREFHSLEDKLGLLIKRYLVNFDFKNQSDWKNIILIKDIRNNLIHSKVEDDVTKLEDYDKNMKNALSSIIIIMDKLYGAIFNVRLRPKLLDLIPE